MTDAELNGKITAIDMEKRTIALKDVDGILHPFTWTEPLDVVMRKWKAGYYLTVKHDGEILKSAVYWQEGKDKFPKSQQGGGRSYQPRNERIIVLQTALKVAADVLIARGLWDISEKTFADQMTEITVEAVRAADALCTAGKVA